MNRPSRDSICVSDKSEPYTRAEIDSIGDAFPSRGEYCPRCENYIPEFADLTEEDAAELRKMKPLQAMKALRDKTNCPLTWAKIWALHLDGPHALDPSKPCPHCGLPLHVNAQQCLLCKMDWHNADEPIRRGKSIADEILNAPDGATIAVAGRNALGSAITYAQINRPNGQLTFVLQPISKASNSDQPS